MTWTQGTILYFIAGAIFAAYADYSVNKAAENPLLGLVVSKPSGVERAMNAVIVVIGWPIFLIKRIIS